MSRILVTGVSGLLGINFALQYAGQHEVIGVANTHDLKGVPFELRQADLAQPGTAARLVAEVDPEIVLHCAAMAVVDRVEADPALAERVNGEVPGELAAAARKSGAMMVHISTDAVFDGVRGDYREEDATNPLNTYALTKLHGEQAVMAANPDAAIARVNFYGWSLSGQRSLGELFFNNLRAGKTMFGFTDVYFCTLQVNVLSEILLRMAQLKLSGIYHTVSSEALSKYDFGCRVARLFGLDAELIQPVSWKEAGLKAARSPNVTLRTERLAAALGQALPAQAAGLELFRRQQHEGLPEKLRQLSQ